MLDKDSLQHTLHDFGYEAISQVGKGGYATCWIVRRKVPQQSEDQLFVCKIFVVPEDMHKKLMMDSYHAEVDALIHLTHINIVQCYDYFQANNCLYLILEYCSGGSLSDLIESGHRISTERLLLYAKHILSAFQYLKSQNICHLDVKPSNILLDKYGRVKLADFGLACHVIHSEMIQKYIGSLAYMAPEILAKQPFDPFASDMWSFGITIYQLATGRLPWPVNIGRHEIEHVIRYGIYSFPTGTHPIVMELVKKTVVVDPKHRATAEQLLAFLEKAMRERQVTVPSLKRVDSASTFPGTSLLHSFSSLSQLTSPSTKTKRRRRLGSTASLLTHSSPVTQSSILPRLRSPTM